MSPELVTLTLSLEEAAALYKVLEEHLEDKSATSHPSLQRTLRTLNWRLAAAQDGNKTGVTGELSEIAKRTTSVEEYESERGRILGPLLDALENQQNRDP